MQRPFFLFGGGGYENRDLLSAKLGRVILAPPRPYAYGPHVGSAATEPLRDCRELISVGYAGNVFTWQICAEIGLSWRDASDRIQLVEQLNSARH